MTFDNYFQVLTNGTCDSNGHVPKNHSKVSQRKKKIELEREHLLEQKLLTARRQASKVRTTQELVQELESCQNQLRVLIANYQVSSCYCTF